MDEAHWTNSLGEEVDLDNIDREYALNILTTRLTRMSALATVTRLLEASIAPDLDDEDSPPPLPEYDPREDALVQKLRDVILNGRDPNTHDRLRAIRYNALNRLHGKPFRARVR